jgi:hypothetical protein
MEVVGFIALFIVLVGLLMIPTTFLARILTALFSSRSREEIRKRKIFHLVWFGFSILLFLLFFGNGPGNLHAAKRAKTQNIREQIWAAVANYQAEYGVPPSATDNASLVRILAGGNPRKIEFINLKAADLNAKGEVLDAWGLPFKITIKDPSHPVMWSDAPDKFVNMPETKTGI